MSFSQLGLSDKVLAAVEATGYTTPTPIQAQAIPHIIAGSDVLGIAQTGTGKTAAFVLPMLTKLAQGRARARMPRTLILEPTRELAAQVAETFDRYGLNQKISIALLIGGVSFDDQIAKLTRGVDVLIATPGRLLDHYERGRLLLTGVELLVIDEADRMLDMGFIPDIERIGKLVPFSRQTLFFTATMPSEIQHIADTFLHNPQRIEVSRPATAAITVAQSLITTNSSDPAAKRDTLRRLLRGAEGLQNAIIFCNRKRDVALLHRSLVRHGFNAVALHGDMEQPARMAALDQFRKGEAVVLVASDVAARGLDIPAVSHVFNFDVPYHPDDYIHRIGRTGRAGRAGTAVTIATPIDSKSVGAIEKLTGMRIARQDPLPEDASAGQDANTRPERTDHPAERPRSNRRPRNDRSQERQRERSREPGSGAQQSPPSERPHAAERPAASSRSPMPVARIEDARRSREPRQPASDEAALSQLPAFLLRPVRVKA
jgi:superfamily II DNA/RNA helicase